MARSSGGVSALSRALRVLDTFTLDAPYLTLSEIMQRTSLPLSTVHGVVRELQAQGLLERMDDHTYRLGNRLWELGTRTPGALGLRETSLPHLQGLHSAVRQHVLLHTRLDLDALVVERFSARDAVVNLSVVGGRIPMQHSGGGLAILAHAGEEVVQAVLERGLDPVTTAGIQDEKHLRSALARIRDDGFIAADGFIHPGSMIVSVPVFGAENAVVGAVGLVVASESPSLEAYLTLLRRTGAAISASLRRSYLPPDHPVRTRGQIPADGEFFRDVDEAIGSELRVRIKRRRLLRTASRSRIAGLKLLTGHAPSWTFHTCLLADLTCAVLPRPGRVPFLHRRSHRDWHRTMIAVQGAREGRHGGRRGGPAAGAAVAELRHGRAEAAGGGGPV
ncbi:IclR family transcriptional regulator C-terminal domain-containing protein [Nesterenkonia sp. NBAIMH1]|uniref:IclR family transcriptional regulator n=1 Tax=Nesterenkonia sp. NBAIMH1 TaxID=2600320 RepID=UPI0011B853D8